MKRTNTGQIGTGEIRKIKMLTGHEIPLDGDLLYVLESLYREVTLSRELKATFEEMMQEIVHLVEEMDEDARKRYLTESLFLNTVTYENERLGAYMRKLTGGTVHDEVDGPGGPRKGGFQAGTEEKKKESS